MGSNFWTRVQRRRISRRGLLATGAMAGAGLAAAAVVGCGGGEEAATPTPAAGTPAGATPTPTPVTPKRGGTMNAIITTTYSTTFDPHKSGASATRSRVNSRLFIAKSGPGTPFLISEVGGMSPNRPRYLTP